MKKIFSILIGKIVLKICKAMGRGSSTPGAIAFKFNKNILSDFKLPNKIIAVTGSSGKGSTSKIIAEVYKDLGYKVVYNCNDSNERGAIISTLLGTCHLNGKVDADVCVFEIDERYTKYVFPYIKPTHVVITNITRDQPPRQRHFDFIFEEINRALNSDIHLIMNGDDPYLQLFNLNNKFEITYYGINKLIYDYDTNKFESLNINRCPKCNNVLNYNYYHIEHVGNYKCSNCDFKNPQTLYNITNCDYEKNIITINDKYNINITNNMLFNLYNILAAFTTLAITGLNEKDITKCINKINNDIKIYNNYKINDRQVYVLNNKAENASTYNQSILFTIRNNNLKTIVLGWKEISRRYNFDDLSWLYDIDFELLNNVDTFICAGPQKYDIANRLKYAGFDEKKIRVFNDLYEAKDDIKNSKGDIYAILNFDYIKPFNEVLEEK